VSEDQMDCLYPPKRCRFFLEDRLREHLRGLRERDLEKDEDPFAPSGTWRWRTGRPGPRPHLPGLHSQQAGLLPRPEAAPGLQQPPVHHRGAVHPGVCCRCAGAVPVAAGLGARKCAVRGSRDLAEDDLAMAEGIRLRAIRKGNSKRYHQPSQFIATLGRKIIESVGSALTELFPLWDSCHHPPGLCAQGVGLHLCPQLQAAGRRFVGSNLG
jgi:hypothetical protein